MVAVIRTLNNKIHRIDKLKKIDHNDSRQKLSETHLLELGTNIL